MLDRQIVQNAGARNVEHDGVVVGFEFRVRMPNYRGLWASLIEGIDVTVDGRTWDRDVPEWKLQGRRLTFDELAAADDVRWQLDEAATIFVPLKGGLTVGVHHVEVGIALQAPYIPAEFQPSVFRAERDVVVVA